MRDIISVLCEIIAIIFWFTIWIIGIGMILAGSESTVAVMGFLGMIISPCMIAGFRRERANRQSHDDKKKDD